MFSSRSRYYQAPTDKVRLANGTEVTMVRFPHRSQPMLRGYHPRLEGQRLDQIAAHYLKDATKTWLLCDANGAISPDTLAAHDLVGIPRKG